MRGRAGDARCRLRCDRRGRAALDAAVRGRRQDRRWSNGPRDRPGALCRRSRSRWCWRRIAISPRTRSNGSRSSTAAAGRSSIPKRPRAPTRRCCIRRVGSNVVSDRRFRYGDPEAAFAAAAHRIAITTRYPRNSGTPIECFVVIAEYLPGEDAYEVTANFQGPFAMHPVMAMALGVPGNRLRLKTPPDSGGSFGAKHAVFPYIVLMCARGAQGRAAGQMGRDRLEHLTRRDLGDQPGHDSDRGRRRARRHHRARSGTSSKIAAPICARPSRRRSTACTAT